MRVGSLFSGIGGLDLGLERAGMKVQWMVEKDEYAQKVLRKHWPDVELYDDVRAVGAGLRPVDLICGGFPCQDISVAGKGAGLAGARSGLWREFRRIIEELGPSWVLIENVPALRTRGLHVVLGDLHALGFDAEWDGLPAVAFGAPHRRDRLFVVAYARGQSLRLEQGWGSGANGTGATESGRNGESGTVAHANGARLEERIFQPPRQEREATERGGLSTNAWSVEPNVGRVAHGVPARVHRLRCLGNSVVPQVAEHIGRLIMEAAR